MGIVDDVIVSATPILASTGCIHFYRSFVENQGLVLDPRVKIVGVAPCLIKDKMTSRKSEDDGTARGPFAAEWSRASDGASPPLANRWRTAGGSSGGVWRGSHRREMPPDIV